MPRKLSDIAYDYERATMILEGAEERLAEARRSGEKEVKEAENVLKAVRDRLYRALEDNPDKTLLAGKYAYYLRNGFIVRTDPWYGHETWVDDPPPAEPLRSKLGSAPYHTPDPMPALATAWGTVEPITDEAEFTDTEPNGQPVTICPD